MVAIRWCMPVLLIVICMIGQHNAGSWPVKVQDIDASTDGHVFAMTHDKGVRGSQIIRWNEDLSQRVKLFEIPFRHSGLHVNHDGTSIACVNSQAITVYDAQTGQRRWNNNAPVNLMAMPTADRKSILAVTSLGSINRFAIYDFVTGDLVSEAEFDGGSESRVIRNIYLDPDRVTVLYEHGRHAAYRVVDDQVHPFDEPIDIKTLGKFVALNPYVPYRKGWPDKRIRSIELNDGKRLSATEKPWAKSSEIRIEDSSTGKVIHSDSLKMPTARHALLNTATACLAFVLMMLWRLDRLQTRPSKSGFFDRSLLVDLLVLGGLVSMPHLVYHGTMVPDEVVSAQSTRFLAIAMGIVISTAFFGLQLATRPLYRWAIALFFCMFPLLIPTILAAILLWSTRTGRLIRQWDANKGTEDPNKKSVRSAATGFRFGILEMLGATAAFALLMGVGRFSFEFFGYGVAIALWLLISFFLSSQTIPAAITMLVCLFFVGFEDPRSDETFLALLVVSVTMTFCTLRLMNHFGSILRHKKQEQPRELSECQGQQSFGEGPPNPIVIP